MTKKKVEIELYSYGEYSQWNRKSKAIPKLKAICDEIIAEVGTEFGYVLKIKKAKGKTIDFRIDHPPFIGKAGNIAPSFEGTVFINSNYYEFFLGDCIWEPAEDKMGTWTMTSMIDGKIVAQKSLNLVSKSPKKGD